MNKILASGLTLMWVGWAWGGGADLKPLQGTWTPVAGEMTGLPLPEEFLRAAKLTIAGEKYSVTVSGKNDEGMLKLDAAKRPRAMDIIGTDGPNKGKTILAIYEVKGDVLKICYALDGKDRPKDFKTLPKTDLFLLIYKKAK